MFTGLVQKIGTVVAVARGSMTRMRVETSEWEEEYLLGESIALDGACQTVVAFTKKGFEVEASPETIRCTTMGSWREGTRVHLERALRVSDRLGGHLVLGHIDAVARLISKEPEGGSLVLGFMLDAHWSPLVVEKGSIAVDGVSLTVSRLEKDRFYVALIPESAKRTTFAHRKVGSEVNIETDIIGKHVARLMGKNFGVQEEAIKKCGFGF